ncbi:hypothetical protein [Thermoproteus tenax]|uniref:hypothetical protein n=1 Tax=Thermoproteus tenax TaxID=2271 RepID=UPI00069A496A|nr:hypothetical protein [Thermoproteus tenax]
MLAVCLTKELLVKFYSSMDFSLRALIHYKSLAAFGYPFDKILLEEPWRTYGALRELLGDHNAQLILSMMSKWLNKNGCSLDIEKLKKYLSDRGLWT